MKIFLIIRHNGEQSRPDLVAVQPGGGDLPVQVDRLGGIAPGGGRGFRKRHCHSRFEFQPENLA
jgi:hypothetical protein